MPAFYQNLAGEKATQDLQATCTTFGAGSIPQSVWMSVHFTLIDHVPPCCWIELSAHCLTASGPASTLQECLKVNTIGMLE